MCEVYPFGSALEPAMRASHTIARRGTRATALEHTWRAGACRSYRRPPAKGADVNIEVARSAWGGLGYNFGRVNEKARKSLEVRFEVDFGRRCSLHFFVVNVAVEHFGRAKQRRADRGHGHGLFGLGTRGPEVRHFARQKLSDQRVVRFQVPF